MYFLFGPLFLRIISENTHWRVSSPMFVVSCPAVRQSGFVFSGWSSDLASHWLITRGRATVTRAGLVPQWSIVRTLTHGLALPANQEEGLRPRGPMRGRHDRLVGGQAPTALALGILISVRQSVVRSSESESEWGRVSSDSEEKWGDAAQETRSCQVMPDTRRWGADGETRV